MINEIMYQPQTAAGAEFVELMNTSGASIDLGGWMLEGAAFTIPTGTSIAAGGLLLVLDKTSTTEAQFRAAHNVPAAVPIVGGVFDLGQGGESLEQP